MKDKIARDVITEMGNKLGFYSISFDEIGPNVIGLATKPSPVLESPFKHYEEAIAALRKDIAFQAVQLKLDALVELLGVEFNTQAAQDAKLVAVKKGKAAPRPKPDEGGRK